MADGFEVDLTALGDAVNGIIDTMDQMATQDVAALELPGSDLGDRDLAGAFRDFCVRWDIGVEALEKDVSTVIDVLVRVHRAYRGTDEANAAEFAGTIRRTSGEDPGVP